MESCRSSLTRNQASCLHTRCLGAGIDAWGCPSEDLQPQNIFSRSWIRTSNAWKDFTKLQTTSSLQAVMWIIKEATKDQDALICWKGAERIWNAHWRGVKADPNRVKAILKMERPTDVAAVWRLVGLVNYQSKFLRQTFRAVWATVLDMAGEKRGDLGKRKTSCHFSGSFYGISIPMN